MVIVWEKDKLSCLWSTAIDQTVYVMETGKTDASHWSKFLHLNLNNCLRLIKRFQLRDWLTDTVANFLSLTKWMWQLWWAPEERDVNYHYYFILSFFSLSTNNLKMAFAIKLFCLEVGKESWNYPNKQISRKRTIRQEWIERGRAIPSERKEEMAPEPSSSSSLSLWPHLYGTVDESDKIKGSTSEDWLCWERRC